ncbi:urease accessory protein [Hymenobacter sp. BT664]|uniref:Nickel/cobalt efflux system n=1 Tax=Hymenobacter montanus TaxID=2771359 RepID=A0A927BDP6_9BACT|nr:urease accessory protein [Hymenobacter montanus]MBD2768259.1 urease accessory protein [Hymenobacter montanus]
MESLLPILFAFIAGTGHAFEPDHLLAVGNLISRRDTLALALRDGVYWGLGHTTMLVVVGSLILLSRATFLQSSYFEAAVGLMLIVMGASRLIGWRRPVSLKPTRYPHRLAYTVGLLHGLAGSGALVLLVMSEIRQLPLGVLYLFVFGAGSILGMVIVAGLCSIPFTKRMRINRSLQFSAIMLSSVLCIVYGGRMIYENVRW